MAAPPVAPFRVRYGAGEYQRVLLPPGAAPADIKEAAELVLSESAEKKGLCRGLWSRGSRGSSAWLLFIAPIPLMLGLWFIVLRQQSVARFDAARGCACATPACDAARLLAYPLPAYFPFPALPMVMESLPRACDLCWDGERSGGGGPSPCERISEREEYEPDAHVREALASVLAECRHAPPEGCRVLDAGGNMGFFTLYALAMGASVVYVEPQVDLVAAMRASVALNCAEDRVQVIHAALSPESVSPRSARLTVSVPAFRSCQRPGDAAKTQNGAGPGGAPIVSIDSLIASHREWALMKVDIDSTDALIVERVLQLIREGRAVVRSIIVEWNSGAALGSVLHAFQQELGYDIYRLNVHDNRRFINASGWDTHAHFQPINLEPHFEELLHQRYIRYVLKVRPLPRPEDWDEIAAWGMMPEFLITRVPLSEAVHANERKQRLRLARLAA
jgi:FkbM family methyltransferase